MCPEARALRFDLEYGCLRAKEGYAVQPRMASIISKSASATFNITSVAKRREFAKFDCFHEVIFVLQTRNDDSFCSIVHRTLDYPLSFFLLNKTTVSTCFVIGKLS